MSLTAIIKAGCKPTSYRAYATVKLEKVLRSKSDLSKTKLVTYPAEEPVMEGSVTVSGDKATGTSVSLSASNVVNKVVFYQGTGDETAVVGSVDVMPRSIRSIVIALVDESDFEPDDFK